MATKKPKRPIGRPTIYTSDLAAKLCNEIAKGKSLRKVCLAEDMPDITTVFDWLRIHKEFIQQYARATDERTEAHQELILDLGDEAIALSQELKGPQANAAVQAVKLKADNLKWVMSKMKPKKYGDKIDMTSDGKALPTPLLHVIRDHDSNGKDSSAQ